ncbi:MAG: amino acid ABC transporter permease [Pseudomonadota bacterium]
MSGEDANRPFVREELLPALAPPMQYRGVIGWLRAHLFINVLNSVLTLIVFAAIIYFVNVMWHFFFVNATFTGVAREDCLPNPGACYPYLKANMGFFIYAFYPEPERWRVNIAALYSLLSILALLWPSFPSRKLSAVNFFVLLPVIVFFLLYGGVFGLQVVETYQWGGMIVTFVVAITGIVFSLPLGIFLALGRRSKMAAIRMLSIVFIEVWRGVPLVTVLFMASIMLPLFLPSDMSPDKLLRALVGVTLFSSAYMAEVVRGGLQAIPKGQYEAASALGLSYWQGMIFIVLPQALKKVIPGIVNTFIGLFKDTSLVFIVGLVDFLKAIDMSLVNPNWATPWTRYSGYAFGALFYFICCWSMSRYSVYMENRLSAGENKKV